jgi:hypothetical protein
LVTIKLLTVTGPAFAEPSGLSADSQLRITSSFESTGARLLRLWDAPSKLVVPDSGLLIVRDPPELGATSELLASERLRLVDAISVVPFAPSSDPRIDLDAIGRRLPREFPDELLRGLLIAPGGPGAAILGLAMCPDCGGWGRHIDPDCPRA